MEKWCNVIKAGADPYNMENWMRLLLTEQRREAMREEGYIVIEF